MMNYKYWGFIQVTRGGWKQRENTAESVTEEINPALLPDWIKVKMAMLDLMSGKTALPCGSYKIVYSRSSTAAWFIYKDVSSVRQSAARERSVESAARERSVKRAQRGSEAEQSEGCLV